jgi:hypothetical protein
MANIELDGVNKKIKVDSGDLTLDVPGDIVLDADGGDVVFADGGTNLLKVTNSSSDVVLQPQVDTKDIIFKQYDGTTVATVEDNATFNIPASKLAIGGTAVTSTAAELNIVDGNTSATSTTIADADRVVLNDNGTMVQAAVTDLKTYIGGFDVSSITGATALAEQPAAADEIVISDNGTLKRVDIKHIQNTPSFYAYMSASQDISTGTHTKVDFDSEYYDTDSTYDTGNQRWTPGVAGKYWVSAGLGYTNWNTSSGSVLADKTISVFIRINGSSENIKSLFHTQHTAISSTQSSVGTLTTGIMDLDNDDYIEVFTNHNSGHDAAIYYQYSWFSGFRISGL